MSRSSGQYGKSKGDAAAAHRWRLSSVFQPSVFAAARDPHEPLAAGLIVEETLRMARRTVALALAAAALLVMLAGSERIWFLESHDHASERLAQAERISGDLLLADERMAMSAHMAAVTGEERWIARHHDVLPHMEAALAAGERLAPTAMARRYHERSKASSERLIEMETSALEAVSVGAPQVARTILESERYRQDRAALGLATHEFTDSTVQAMRQQVAALRLRSWALGAGAMLLSLAVALLTWRRLTLSLARSRAALLQAQARLQRAATTDALTGLPNRGALHASIERRIERAQQSATGLALLMIDLDGFKQANDLHGHQTGDRVLQEVARRIHAVLRDEDGLFRVGGDEFVAVVDDAAVALAVAERVVAALACPIAIDGISVLVGASVGVACCPDDAQDIDDLWRFADLALYRAKREGRGRVCRYDAALDHEHEQSGALQSRLREAILRGRIEPHYQPVVDLRERRVKGLELLARWRDGERGMVEPAVFIPLAERAGLMRELTLSLLRRACADLPRLPARWRIAINVAPASIQDRTLCQQLLGVIEEAGCDPRRFEVELTETALVRDLEAARHTIQALKQAGIGVALDDFGTGYSSLNVVSQLSFDKIKIDRSFVATLHERGESAKVVASIIGLGSSLGVQVVAEGVETERDAATLAALGCPSAQGWLFGRPMPLADLLHGSEATDFSETVL